jgi:hypothetical protein
MMRLVFIPLVAAAFLPEIHAQDRPVLPPGPAPGPAQGTAPLIDALCASAQMPEAGKVMFSVPLDESHPKKPSRPPAVFAKVDGKAVPAVGADRQPLDGTELSIRLPPWTAVVVVHDQPPDPFFLKVLNRAARPARQLRATGSCGRPKHVWNGAETTVITVSCAVKYKQPFLPPPQSGPRGVTMSPRSPKALSVCLSLIFAAVGTAVAGETKAPAPFARLRGGETLENDALKQPLTLADGSKTWSIALEPTARDKVIVWLYPADAEYNLFGDRIPEPDPPQPPPLREKVEATLKPLAQADPAKRGRRLFTLAGKRLGERLVLVVPAKETDSYRLVACDRAGKVTDVIPLQVQEPRVEPCHPGCFPAGTIVATPDGPRRIETIRAGDAVLNVPASGAPTPRKVAAVFAGQARLVEVQTATGRLVTTGRQPLTLAHGATKGAAELRPGDAILRWQDGEAVTTKVRGVKWLSAPGRVFNLVLETRGTFIANGYLVRSKPPAQ